MQAYDQLVTGRRPPRQGARRSFRRADRPVQPLARPGRITLLGDAHLAQDVTQEAFHRYQRIDHQREPAAFPGWLKRIVLTYCHRANAPQSAPAAAAGRRGRPTQAAPRSAETAT